MSKKVIVLRISILFIVLILTLALLIFVVRGNYYNEQLTKRVDVYDNVFASNFQSLCSTLWIQNLSDAELVEELNDENIKYAAACNAVFGRTSYRDSKVSNDLSNIVSCL